MPKHDVCDLMHARLCAGIWRDINVIDFGDALPRADERPDFNCDAEFRGIDV